VELLAMFSQEEYIKEFEHYRHSDPPPVPPEYGKNRSDRQIAVGDWWRGKHDILAAFGTIRAGKTHPLSRDFVFSAVYNYDQSNFIIVGRSIKALKKNFITALIRDLKRYKNGKRFKVQTNWTDAVVTITRYLDGKIVSVNYFHLYGGSKAGDEEAPVGLTVDGVFIDEGQHITEAMFDEVMGRCALNPNARFWVTGNPRSPQFWFYQKYILPALRGERKDVRVEPYSFFDNPTMSGEAIKKILNRWPEGSVYYLRNVCGLWTVASGLCYAVFANNKERFHVPLDEKTLERKIPPIERITIGIDYGKSKSHHAFIAVGILRGMRGIVVLASETHEPNKTEDGKDYDEEPKHVFEKIIKFIRFVQNKYGKHGQITNIYSEHDSAYINGTRKAMTAQGLQIPISNAKKEPISERITTLLMLMSANAFSYVPEDNAALEIGLCGAVYDDNEERLDDETMYGIIDSLDSLEYAFGFYTKTFSRLYSDEMLIE